MNKLKKINLISILMFLILIQPIFDVLIYFCNKVIFVNIPFISIIRPLISVITYVILLFNYNITNKQKKISFVYLCIYFFYCLLHLINIRNNFFDLSYGSISDEIRYLCNFGYFIIQLINYYLIFKITNKNQQKKIILSIIYGLIITVVLYFISVGSGTSPNTYLNNTKFGWKGWSVSSHHIGHIIVYFLPVVIYAIFEKQYIKSILKYVLVILIVVPSFYLIGTKTPLFATLLIILFYAFIKIIECIKKRKLDSDTIFFVILSILLLSTFKYTFGYDNFEKQVSIATGDGDGEIEIINDNLKIDKKYSNNNLKFDNFEDRFIYVIQKNKNIKSYAFDNRSIQKILNKDLRKISTLKDKIFGYGHSNMPNCTWVETDFYTIFYCYGLLGLLLTIIIPFGFFVISGIKCLKNYKQLNSAKLILGFGFGLGLFTLYSVGYTMQFAQTVYYLIILLVVCDREFNNIKLIKNEKDYLFAINDLNIGGAEVGLVDVINELVRNGKKVDLVLLRKRGPLLEKVDKNVEIYEILNSSYPSLKRKIYYILYMLGGPFIKYVYYKTIPNKYKTEVAYIEGYPAVFIAASNNRESVKVASIRVGLKNHKLKASKLPWGEFEVKKAYKKMDNIYTVSDLSTNEFIEKYPKCKNKVRTIYTYFNVEDIRKKSNESYDYKYDKTKVNFLAVGRFSEQKSYDRLIKAFYEISQKHSNVLLHFVGNYDTEVGTKILSLIKKLELNDKIILHGVKNNPYPYIKDCDCLISSSLYEGFPRVINEAICIGKLCIGTNVTGTKEALQEGKLGILVDNSVEGLIHGMNEFLNNVNIYNNYKKAIKEFDGNKETYFNSLNEISKKRKKMIIYMPKLSYGGMEKSLINLINYCKINDRYELTLYLVYKGEMNYVGLLPNNLKLIILWNKKWSMFGKAVSSIKMLFEFIRLIFNKYDIAISYSYQHPILNYLTRFSSKNNIVYIHGNLKEGINTKTLKKRLKKCKYEKFNKIICVSENAKNALISLINRNTKIYTINNAIDGDNIISKSQEQIEDFEFKKDNIYFINIARHFEQYKKITRIIDATDKLNKEGYNFDVILVGDGEDHKLYEEKIANLDIKNIHLIGKKNNPYKYLQHSDAFLLSSVREGYPVVFIESMILNKPIITTNISDAKKDIDGKYGYVVDNNDESIYYGMKKYLDKKFEIKQKFNYVEFNLDIIKKTEKVYNEK